MKSWNTLRRLWEKPLPPFTSKTVHTCPNVLVDRIEVCESIKYCWEGGWGTVKKENNKMDKSVYVLPLNNL